MGGIHRRELEIGNDTCLLGFSGRESVDSAVFDASKLSLGGVDEVQTVTLTGSPGGGTFTLAYRDQVTSALAYNASAAVVQAALRALSRIGTIGVTVTGSAGGPYTVTFGGALTKKDVELLVGNGAALTGGTTPAVAVAQATKGSALDAGLYVLKSGLVLTHGDTSDTVKPYTGATDIDEVQTVTISGSPGGGTFTLEFDGEQTTAIAYNATAAAVQAALEVLPNVDAGDVVVTGSAGGPYTATFGGGLGGQSVPLMRATGALTGGTTPSVAVAQTTQGAQVEAIVGIFDGRREFMDNTSRSNKEIPVYNFGCVFDKAKVQGYSAYEDALVRWGRDNACVFKSQGDA